MSDDAQRTEINNFYVYILRRPDKRDPFDETKGMPFYVGKGSNGRINYHRYEAKELLNKGTCGSIKIKIIHKLWKNNLDYKEDIFIDKCTEEESFYYEQQLILSYGRIDLKTGCLANLTNGGEGLSGLIFSEEHRNKIRNANLGTVKSEEIRKKISKTKKGALYTEDQRIKNSNGHKGLIPWNKGKFLSEETKRKMSEIRKGKSNGPCSEETKKKLSEALKGRKNGPHSLETRQKISKSNTGKPLSETHKLKLSKAHKGKILSEEHRKQQSISRKGKPWTPARRKAEILRRNQSLDR